MRQYMVKHLGKKNRRTKYGTMLPRKLRFGAIELLPMKSHLFTQDDLDRFSAPLKELVADQVISITAVEDGIPLLDVDVFGAKKTEAVKEEKVAAKKEPVVDEPKKDPVPSEPERGPEPEPVVDEPKKDPVPSEPERGPEPEPVVDEPEDRPKDEGKKKKKSKKSKKSK